MIGSFIASFCEKDTMMKKLFILLSLLLFSACEKKNKSFFSDDRRNSSAFATVEEAPNEQPKFLTKKTGNELDDMPPNGGYSGPEAVPNQPLYPPSGIPGLPPTATDDDLAPPLDPRPGPILFPYASCGNKNFQGVKQCDLGEANKTNSLGCNIVCGKPYCGNGVTELLGTIKIEECDDGNNIDGDGCSARCLFERCGNKRIDPGEQCDDGNNIDGDGCSACCTLEKCGNDIPDLNEECDEGKDNGSATGTCSDICTRVASAIVRGKK